jgi:hypothetical protein
MYTIPYLEIPITHVCNFHCDGCSAYSNYGLKNQVTPEELNSWLLSWRTVILEPMFIRVLGGEPFLHPKLPEILKVIRKNFPLSQIQLVTNGFSIDRYKDIPKVLSELKIEVWLSIHANNPIYNEKLETIVRTLFSWREEFGVDVSRGDNVVHWNRFYRGLGKNMKPFLGNDSRKSWESCHSKSCLNLLEGNLWKCPQIANLHLIVDRFELNTNDTWKPYLNYKGVSATDSKDILDEFFNKEEEECCSMCPIDIVNYKKDIYNTDFTLQVERVDAK